jgi:leucyl aminopeptidase
MINFTFTDNFNEEASHICIFVNEQKELSNHAMLLDKKFNGVISKGLKSFHNFFGKAGEVKVLTATSKGDDIHRIIIIGSGKDSERNNVVAQNIGGSIASFIKSSGAKSLFVDCENLESFAADVAFGIKLGCYNFDKYRTTLKDHEKPTLETIELFVNDAHKATESFRRNNAIADAILAARDVISEPGNIIYPESYAEVIRDTLEPLGVEVEIIGEREMKNLGMGALLGVGQGSIRESKLVVMKYMGAENEDDQPLAFVGKGVTFDTGGISIKPAANMGDMKYDMSGSAAVFGTIYALAARDAKVNAVGVVGLVENMPGGNAQRPGDVVKSMSGQTIEILNTDAEGRLVLADALWYTQEKFKPKFMIDLATLTGAVIIALGNEFGGLFSNNEDLSAKLLEAGKDSGEQLWRLPLCAEFDKMINSSIADVANLGTPSSNASSSTAAQFLQRFVNNVPWAHLDIAGVANLNKGKPISPKGAVGFGVRLLNRFVEVNYEQ